jgi:hypothetical protein
MVPLADCILELTTDLWSMVPIASFAPQLSEQCLLSQFRVLDTPSSVSLWPE